MEKDFLLKRLLFFSLLLFLLMPSMILLSHWDGRKIPWEIEAWWALRGAVLQSTLSAFFVLLGGLIGSLGMFSRKIHWGWQAFLLLPGFLPPILSLTLMFRWWPSFPLGLLGVVGFHFFLNVGVSTLLWESLIRSKALSWIELSLVEGRSTLSFLCKGLLPNLKKEIFFFMVFWFLVFFSSFSIPFLVGGSFYGGVEVYIYEKIFLYNQWNQALVFSLGLLLFFLLVGLTFQSTTPSFYRRTRRMTDENISWGTSSALMLPFLPSGALVLGGVWSLFLSGNLLSEETLILSKNSLLFGLGTGLLLLLLFSILSYCDLSSSSSRRLFFLSPPGWMVASFGFFLAPGDSSSFLILKTLLCSALVFFPYLYRIGLFPVLQDLRSQIEVARVCGQSWTRIFFKVVFPQVLPSLAFVSGLGGAWAVGDFGILSVLSPETPNFGLAIKDLFLNYRMHEAHALLLPFLFVLFIVFISFQGLGYVARRIHL